MLRRLRSDSGQALVMSLMTMMVLTIVAGTTIFYTTSSEHESSYSKAQDTAYRLAESGVNNATAVLGNPNNNALTQSTLPSTQATADTYPYTTGTSKWWGVFNSSNSTWLVTGMGLVTNPTNSGIGAVTRTISATVPVQPSLTQPVNNQVWNYLYATGTGHTCDETIQNSVILQISLYVAGNFCTRDSSSMAPATTPPTPAPAVNLVVGGTYTSNNSSHIGASGTGNAINQAIIVGGCNGHSPCKFNGAGDPVFATSTGSSIPGGNVLTPPVANFSSWYTNAQLGPKAPCTTSSGTPPVFENEVVNPTMNNSVPTTFNLTPSTSYTCSNANGTLSWNASTDVLTVKGVIYIDGSVTSTAAVASYVGESTMYVSGTFTLLNSSQFCGGVSSGQCNFAAWNPNTSMLIICAENMGNATNAIDVANSSHFQGGLFAPTTQTITVSDSAQFEGPMIGGNLNIGNSVQAKPLPTINTVPLGAPGNPNTYAQPQAPGSYSG